MINMNFLSAQLKSSTLKRNRFSGLLGTSFLLMLVALTTWQCRDDDFTGEVIGVCPEVITTSPAYGALNVVSDKLITATFNEAMDPASINENTFFLMRAGVRVAGIVTYSGTTATFSPAGLLHPNSVYTATVKRESKDLMGSYMAKDTTWSFATGVLPLITITNPINGSVNVSIDAIVSATFSKKMNPLTISPLTFMLKRGTTAVAGAVSYKDMTATFTPAAPLLNGVEYTATISAGVKDVSGKSIPSDSTWKFSTAVEVIISGPMGIDLGSAANFAVLAGSGVSNTGVTTQITGDVDAFPTATINGLLAGNVIGTLYVVADPIVGLAKTDLTTAYNDAQGRSVNAISLPGQLGGLTLAPGLYVNSSTSGISGTGANGILTLDAGGNPNAVWIFRMGSTLITDAGTSIVLAGGAQAKNIYWSVGTSATLGTNSAFFGNILADQSITLTTGATLIGRALTRIGAVTLDTNTVIKP